MSARGRGLRPIGVQVAREGVDRRGIPGEGADVGETLGGRTGPPQEDLEPPEGDAADLGHAGGDACRPAPARQHPRRHQRLPDRRIGHLLHAHRIETADGKVVVGIWHGEFLQSGANRWGLGRYNVDGSKDTGFGNSGKVFSTFTGCVHQRVNGIALQADGKIVGVGTYQPVGTSTYYWGTLVARYHPNGALDSSLAR